MKKIIAPLLALVTLVSCNSQKDVKLGNDDLKTIYTVGTMFGERMNSFGLSDEEVGALIMGVRDAAKGDKPKVEVAEFQAKVPVLFQDRMERNKEKMKKESVEIKKKGSDYLENFVKNGGTKTASGLAYKVTVPGSEKKPMATDEVEVHYHGTLIDGTVFDSSKDRGKTAKFPLNRVIKGWTEGLQLVGEGGSIKLVIPSELAYGDERAVGKIPPGSTLVFEVELIKISDAKETQAPEMKIEAPKKK
ncbi:MAG: FKBP-type peptidyl-prolyl cis-trans isomerase [Halobacteriovoraceae bacterium]|nr:FKBP-type peptidyl-prolyl cis-trans isomerase [Halobacteriovoraceae bacterium]